MSAAKSTLTAQQKSELAVVKGIQKVAEYLRAQEKRSFSHQSKPQSERASLLSKSKPKHPLYLDIRPFQLPPCPFYFDFPGAFEVFGEPLAIALWSAHKISIIGDPKPFLDMRSPEMFRADSSMTLSISPDTPADGMSKTATLLKQVHEDFYKPSGVVAVEEDPSPICQL